MAYRRYLRLWLLLTQTRGVALHDLSKALDVSERTVRRYLHRFRALGARVSVSQEGCSTRVFLTELPPSLESALRQLPGHPLR